MRGAAIYAGVFGSAAALFLLMPGLDLTTSRLFFDPGRGFILANWPPLRALEGSIPWIAALIVVIVAAGTARLWLTGRPCWRLDGKALVFIVAATALGPGLLANVVLKDHWGRARPAQIEDFGGGRRFTPAPLPAAQCERNCAFVSGHAALGFSLVSFAFLLPLGRRRKFAKGAAFGVGALIGLGRVAAGRHFLSDVVFAGLLIFGTTWLLHEWIVVRDGLRALGARAAAGVARAGWLAAMPARRMALWVLSFAGVEAASIGWADRPVAYFFHGDGAFLQPFFGIVGRLGFAVPYLVLCALGYAALRWGAAAPPMRASAEPMRAAARVVAFFFAAIAASGLIVDLMKVLFGRARPKLLFAGGTYDFGWFGLQADHWSFPSGHAATAAALMTAVWCLWPRPVLLYTAVAILVAMSRVVTGAHYLSDTLMGAAVAVVVTRILAGVLLSRHLAFDPAPGQHAAPAVPRN